MKDWKNIISSVIGLLIAVSGALLGVQSAGEVVFPGWLTTTCIITMAVGAAVVAWLQGRNADLTRKSHAQLRKQYDMRNGSKPE